MITSTPTPGRWILHWGGYSQHVTVYHAPDGELRFTTPSGYSHPVGTVPDGSWEPAMEGGPR